MRHYCAGTALLLAATTGLGGQAVVNYQKPAPAILRVMEAPRPPRISVSPGREYLLLMDAVPNPDIADLAQPMLRIAGLRIDPTTFGRHATPRVKNLRLERIGDGTIVALALPASARHLTAPFWSPGGARFAFTNITRGGIELWIGEAATGRVHRIPGVRLNAVMGAPCTWMPGAAALLCKLVPSGRGPAPAAPEVPTGPTVAESDGHAVPAPTYEDLLKNPHDEDLFDYYATAQLARVNPRTGAVAAIGAPGIFAEAAPSPDGQHLLVSRLHRPYSYLVPDTQFPRAIEVWSRSGARERRLRDVPLQGALRRGRIDPGARGYAWQPMLPATLVYEVALDGGNPATKVPYRDQVRLLAAPFQGEGVDYLKAERRFSGLVWGSAGDLALVTDNDRRLGSRTFVFDPRQAAPTLRLAWQLAPQDRYRDPGTPVAAFGAALGGRVPTAGGRGSGGGIVLEDGHAIYLRGAGASPAGDHPFLDRFDTTTLKAQRLFQSPENDYDSVAELETPSASRLLIAHESTTDPPNLYERTRADPGLGRALTHYADPAPEVRRIRKQLITYKRPSDGVELSTMVYFPPDYQAGVKYPAIVWAYPAEFASARMAGEVAGSTHRFTIMTGYSELYLALDGYVVLDNMTMPILSKDHNVRDANDTYVQQLVEDATAGVNEAARLGFIDPDRVGVAGHSYGAFMVANLLAHSRLFKAGNAQSGAYNRSLTPFGFQNEERTFWDDPALYEQMSPFDYANQIKAPLLLMHGMADNNPGTFPIQSERMYAAVQGQGGTVRFVYLPEEAHGYLAQQTIEDVVWEMDTWFNKYVKK
ncbi:MAG TPA: prolyl oligopeptidase family serine peptidase [Terriglobales bacterium]|nr:prolyl oligopeptidase family serine peptidase [Terriglobales bacterium]